MRMDESLPLITNDIGSTCNTSVEVKKHVCSAERDRGVIEGGAKGQCTVGLEKERVEQDKRGSDSLALCCGAAIFIAFLFPIYS